MTSKNFLCTWNYKDGEDTGDWEERLKELKKVCKAEYIVGQLEKGEETGRPHIQFYIHFKQACRITAITKAHKEIHVEKVKVNNGADRYCMKTETRVEGPIEIGEKPIARNSKTDWESVWEKAKQGKIEEIPAAIRVIHYTKLKAIAKDNMQFSDADHLRGIWIYGKAGSGKSRWVREHCKPLYPKLCNKWWDGYQGEPYVVMDDIMPEHKFLSQQLKIWTDRYDCILETKGGAVHSQYQWFIITSQYSIDEVFEDSRDREALHRRIQEYSIDSIAGLKLELRNLSPCHPASYNTQAAE